MLIEAVDDKRPRPIETGDTLCRHRFERHRHSTRKMLLHEDRLRQHIHEPSTATHEALSTSNIDALRHRPPVPTVPEGQTQRERVDLRCQHGPSSATWYEDVPTTNVECVLVPRFLFDVTADLAMMSQ